MSYVKFYGPSDLSAGYHLEKVEQVLSTLNLEDSSYNINEILELYNITLYGENELYLKRWTKDFILQFKALIPKLTQKVSCYFNSINDANLLQFVTKLDYIFKGDFLNLLVKYKRIEQISTNTFEQCLITKALPLYIILTEKKLVRQYDIIIKNEILREPQNAELLLDKFLVKRDPLPQRNALHFPKSLTKKEMITLLEEYIKSPEPNLNYLRLLINVQSSSEFEVPDETKLKAKHKSKEIAEELFPESSGHAIEYIVRMQTDQMEPVIQKQSDKGFERSFSLDWFEENTDYPTILQNFVYLFEYVDKNMRISLVNHFSEMGALERNLGLTSRKDYQIGMSFRTKNDISNMEFIMYYNFLLEKNIRLEEVIEYFFSDYLLQEFSIEDFRVKLPSSTSSYREKCRDLLPEIETILKQFTHVVKYSKINHELLQMSSSPLRYIDIPSLVENKYVYVEEDKLESVLFHFFSDQSSLSYIENQKGQEYTFFDLLRNNSIQYTEIPEYKRSIIDHLIKTNYLKIDHAIYIRFNNVIRMSILSHLYNFETINYWRFPKVYRNELDIMRTEELVKYDSSLFSIPEQKYFNYHLNKADFSNGLDLRNRYSHGTQPNDPNDEHQHKMNYMILLKLLVLIIIKINDDFCIRADLK